MEKIKYDIFISYRREGGDKYARTIQQALEKQYRVFLDFDELKDGVFDQRIIDAINESPVFLLILSKGALDRCVNEDDWVRQEILHASKSGCHIVPVTIDDTFDGLPASLPEELRSIVRQHQFSELQMKTLFKASMGQLIHDRIAPYVHREDVDINKDPVEYKKGEKLFNEEEYILAIPYFKKAAEYGSTKAMCMLGDIYKNGKDVDVNYKEAIKWYQKAADLGDSDAHNELGWFYYEGIGTEKNYEKAIEHFTFAAMEKSHPRAEYGLGEIYANGNGIKKDINKAIKWYTKAAEQNDFDAMRVLADIYYNGKDIKQDKEKGLYWGMKVIKLSAEQGDSEAQCCLGNCYYDGRGVEQNYEEAVKWYVKAAEQGDSEAQCRLGNCHYDGLGVEQNYEEALKWYTKAAEQGHPVAQFKLSNIYYNGYGVNKDEKKAEILYWKARETGRGEYMIGWEYEHDGDKTEAVRKYRIAAESGYPEAGYWLGRKYLYGDGVNQDDREAAKWFRKAAELGHREAQEELHYMYSCGNGVNQDDTEAAKWYKKTAEQEDSISKALLE